MAIPAIYLRVSSDIQRERESIKSQEDALTVWLASQGLDPQRDVRWYRDDGVSGKTPIVERGEGARLVADIKANLVGGFVGVFSISRLARETSDFFAFRTLLRDHNIALLGISEGVDTRTEAGDFVAGVHALLADEAQRALRKASMAGMKRLAKEGKWISRPPYGYRLEDRLLSIFEPTAQIVREIYRLYLTGKGCHQIADHLNALGLPSPGRSKWQTNIILRILHNPVYKGEGRWNVAEMRLGRRTGRRRPESEHIIITTPALITTTEWEQAQLRLAQGAKQFTKTGAAAAGTLLSRLRCLVCGKRYYRGKVPHGAYYYRHDEYHQPRICVSQNVPAQLIDDEVWRRVQAAIQNPYLWLDEITRRRNQDKRPSQIELDLTQVQEALERNATTLDTLDNMALHGGLTLDRYTPRARELNEQRILLEERRHTLIQQLDKHQRQSEQQQSLAALMESYQAAVTQAGHEEMQLIIDRLISTVRVKRIGHEIEIEIEWT